MDTWEKITLIAGWMDLGEIRLKLGNQMEASGTVQVREQPEEASSSQYGEDGHCGGRSPGWWDSPTV